MEPWTTTVDSQSDAIDKNKILFRATYRLDRVPTIRDSSECNCHHDGCHPSFRASTMRSSWTRRLVLIMLVTRGSVAWLMARRLLETSSRGSVSFRPAKNNHLSAAGLSSTRTWATITEPDSLLQQWRGHPAINPTVEFQSWLVPKRGKAIQTILSDARFRPYLASSLELLDHLHLRLKLVRDNPDESSTHKLVLLNPEAPSWDDLPDDLRQSLSNELSTDDAPVSQGPTVPISFPYHQFTANYILQRILPIDVQPPPTAFETIGHVAHLNLRSHHEPYAQLIGQVLLETLPTIRTVIDKVGEVTGPYRTYNFTVLAGDPSTRVHVVESGVALDFDLRDVYWCSRLSEERQRLLAQFGDGDTIADAFCGVGALCLLAATQKNCRIWANDWNPAAIAALKTNAPTDLELVTCGDAYDFLVDIGMKDRLPHHVVMNYPVEAPSFLGALRWWKASDIVPRVHVYTFARAEGDRSAEHVAMDLVASNLLPPEDRYEALLEYCPIEAHAVRDVAPGKVVYCVTFEATEKLLRSMRGDFE